MSDKKSRASLVPERSREVVVGDPLVQTAARVADIQPEGEVSRPGRVAIEMTQEEWDALRCVLLNLKLVDLLGQREIIRAHPKLVAACHAALSVEGLPTPIRKQLEKALALTEF